MISNRSSLRIIVDECASASSPLVARFRQTLRPEQPVEWVFLAEKHIGIPDADILHRLLSRQTVLLTNDRVLHNRAISLGFRSYTLDEGGNLRHQKFKGVVTRAPLPTAAKIVKDDYRHAPNPIASALTAQLSEQGIKRYRTRRRRIRSYFGSASHITSVSLTVGAKEAPRGLIFGYFLALSGDSGVKGIRASEGYALIDQAQAGPACPLLHALRDNYLLQLETVFTEIYVIPPETLALGQKQLATDEAVTGSSANIALATLLKGLGRVQLLPCAKGRFFDAMEDKLTQLARRPTTNELVPFDVERLTGALLP